MALVTESKTASYQYEVTMASKRDLSVIRRWLKAKSSFYHNFISARRGDVWVCKEIGKVAVLGFLSGRMRQRPSMDIMEVREEHRKRGVGKSLVAFFLEQVQQHDPIGIEIQCEPKSSIGFWRRYGFVEVQHSYQDTNRFHYRALCFQTSSSLSADTERVSVRLKLSEFKGTPSITDFETVAAQAGSELYLQQHFVAYVYDSDTRVEIFVNGASIFKDKVKRIIPIGGERDCSFVRLRKISR